LDATVSTTLPFPVPLAPDLIVTKDALLVAVHVHVAALAPTLTVSVSPPPFAFMLAAPNTYAHAVVVVVFDVVLDGVVDELLEQAPANVAAAKATPASAAERVGWWFFIGRVF
jgi:hypothetical protein